MLDLQFRTIDSTGTHQLNGNNNENIYMYEKKKKNLS